MENLKILKAHDLIHGYSTTTIGQRDLLTRIAILFPDCVLDAANLDTFEFEIKEIWKREGKIRAIMYYRDKKGKDNCGLKEAKLSCEEICKNIKYKGEI